MLLCRFLLTCIVSTWAGGGAEFRTPKLLPSEIDDDDDFAFSKKSLVNKS